MTDTLQRHKNFENVFQIAFVSTVVTLIITFVTIIISSLLPNQLFASGGISILPKYGDGTWNISLLTGLAILIGFFVVYLLPATLGLRNSAAWTKRFLYGYAVIAIVYVVTVVFIFPLTMHRVVNLQGGFYPVIMTLAAIGSYFICSQPRVANRADRKKKQEKLG